MKAESDWTVWQMFWAMLAAAFVVNLFVVAPIWICQPQDRAGVTFALFLAPPLFAGIVAARYAQERERIR